MRKRVHERKGVCDLMDKRLIAEFARQETEDLYRMTESLENSVSEEFGNAKQLIPMIQNHIPYTQAELLEFSINESLVRISAEFSMRKHTSCLLPYYHSHDFYEIIYVWQGAGGQMLPGSPRRIELHEGDLCILTPGMVHTMLPCGAGDIVLKIIVPVPMMKTFLHNLQAENGELADEETGLPEMLLKKNEFYIFYNSTETSHVIKRLVDDLLHETYWGTSYRIPAIKNLLQLLLIALGRSSLEKAEDSIFHEVCSYIRQNIRTANFEDLARHVGYSGRQLRRKIADSTGGTFSDILWRIRIEEAASLLNGSDIPVEEVAGVIGYKSTSGFYKRFVHVFHMTPAAYRKLYRGPVS